MTSWFVVCDIAGRTAAHDPSAWITVSAVGVPFDAQHSVRSDLLGCLSGKPMKWRCSSPEHLGSLIDLVTRRGLPSFTAHVHRTEPAWSAFWRNGRKFHRELTNRTHGKASLFKPGTVLRYVLFEKAVASLIAIIVGDFGVGRAPNGNSLTPLRLWLVLDREIEDAEGQAFLAEAFEHWEHTSRLREYLRIAPEVQIKFTLEQDEPLLLLPDFIAGSLHARILSSKGEALDLPPELVQAATDMRLGASRVFVQREECFSHKYPLKLEGAQVVHVGPA